MTSHWKCDDLERSVLDAWLGAHCHLTNMGTLAKDIRQEQLQRLRLLLVYVKKSSRFYKKKLDHIDPDNFTWADLRLLPFTHPADIINWQDFVCVSQSHIERMVTLHTSGTSGPPKRIAVTHKDLASTKDFFRIGMSQLVSPGQRALILWPGAERPYGVSGLLTEALREGGVSAFAGNPAATVETLCMDLEQYDPHVVVALPKQLSTMAELLLSTSQAVLGQSLRGILSSGEILPTALGKALRETRSCLVLDHYGLTETGYGGGVECPAHSGYHMRELDLLVEIIDINSERVLPFTQEGEVTITTLTREGMPLIRYRTGDIASLLPGPCPCGSPMPRLSGIKGRLLREGNNYRIVSIEKGASRATTNKPDL